MVKSVTMLNSLKDYCMHLPHQHISDGLDQESWSKHPVLDNSFFKFLATHPQLGQLLDFVTLGVADEVVVQNNVGPQAQHFASDRPEKKPWVAVGEVIAEELWVLKMHRLLIQAR